MNTSQILQHFGEVVVFKFSGSYEEFKNYMHEKNTSYNYIIADQIVYFTSSDEMYDDRIEVLTQE